MPSKALRDNQTRVIQEEFSRLLPKSRGHRKHLVLRELLQFRTQGSTIAVDIAHLGVLWVLDR
jgi:hypothetical protein